MSFLDSTMETIKEKGLNKRIDKLKYTNMIKLYGKNLLLSKDSQIFEYNPGDVKYYSEFYNIDKKFIFSESLSPSIIFSGSEKRTGDKIAIKQIKKDKLKEDYLHEMAKNELAIHYSISRICNNIVHVKDYFEDENAYYLIMELAEEPEYFEDLLENKYCPVSDERTLKAFAFDILTGLKEIHNNNIIHCDIKPQNFLLFKNESSVQNDSFRDDELFEDYLLKIGDFGMAHIIPEGCDKSFMLVPCGTFAYTAPEVTKNCYINKSIDIWSFGICLYQMAVAYLPTAMKQFRYGTGPIPFRACDWSGYDFKHIKDLIERCLQMEPSKRIDAHEALNHPWFDG